MVVVFVWGSRDTRVRHRVAANILCLPSTEGGLGLINIFTQAMALLVKALMWGMQLGDHPLQLWIRFQLKNMAGAYFGIPSLAGLLAHRIIARQICSPVLTNMLFAWYFFTNDLSLKIPSRDEFASTLIWGDPQFTVHGTTIKATSSASKTLLEAGFSHLGDLWNATMGTWKEATQLIPNPSIRFINGLEVLHKQFLPPTIFCEDVYQYFRVMVAGIEYIVDIFHGPPFPSYTIDRARQYQLIPGLPLE